jgi:hypothetical protein
MDMCSSVCILATFHTAVIWVGFPGAMDAEAPITGEDFTVYVRAPHIRALRAPTLALCTGVEHRINS